MKLLSKKEVTEELGNTSMWSPKRTVNLFHYLAGVEEFDKKIEIKNIFTTPNIADFEIRPKGLEVRIMDKFKHHRIAVEDEKILSINLEDKEQIYSKKEKSIVGRAIVGGLILGPVGAIVGGMTGLSNSEKKVGMPDLILSVEIKNENKERQSNKVSV